MSITSNFPAIKPTLLLDFANVKQLDPRITFTRASTATYYGTQTAKAEQNLLIYSQQFTNTSGWTSVNASINDNEEVAPDGTSTAGSFFGGAAITGLNSAAASFVASQPLTISIYAKAVSGSTNFLQIYIPTSVLSGGYANFNVAAGLVGDYGGTGLTASIVAASNGFYRCIVSISSVSASATSAATFYMVDASTSARGSSLNYPDQRMVIWGAQLEQRSAVTAYTATTTQAITNYITQLLTAASGVARFDHNPVTDESLGLLIEEQRTNLILQSEDLDTTWTETRATLSLNSVVAPNGALTADRLIASADNNTHFSSQTFTGTAASHTFTVYAKASGLNHVALRLFNGTSQVGLAYYNLSTGATGTVTAGTAAITSVGNGYYRCSLTATLAASASCTADIQLANADNTNSFIGNAFDGVTLWGTQVELGAFATSYIPTVASQVTRAADAASMTGTNFSSWYNQKEGTFFAQFTPAVSNFGINRNIFMASDGTTANSVGVRYGSSGSQPSLSVITASTNQAILVTGAMIAGTSYKLAGAYKANDFAVSRDAGTVGTDISGTVPVVTQAEIGMLAGTSFSTQTIKKLAYYPLRVTNAQLQALTS
jgi:hypothetical protein